MKNILVILLISVGFVSCSLVSGNYISSTGIVRQSIDIDDMQVFYDGGEVPYKYKEIGRIYVKNNYWADRDPAAQINKIKEKAAKNGADAVIILEDRRTQSTFYVLGNQGQGIAGDVIHKFSGIAIIKA